MEEIKETSGSVVELVSRAGRRGIRLWEESGQLKFKAPSGALTPDLRAALSRHKAEILEFLREVSGTATSLEGPGIEPVPREGELPLSFAQERMWLLERWEPETATYSIYDALRLEGDLVAASAAQALGEIRRRHEALRTRFEAVSGRPRLHVDGWRRERLARVDLRGLEPAHREREAHRLVERGIARPFDLSRGPLLRAFLLRQGSTEHVLLVNLHHIVSDGWSTGVLVRELAGLYGAFRRGKPSPFEELAVQYVDYAAWQRERLSGEVLEGEMAWWRERLSGAPRSLDLPTDHSRPAVRTTRGRSLRFAVPEAVTPALRSFGRAEGATAYVVLLSAFAAFLHRMTGQADLVVGSPMAGRLRTEVEPLIGFFVNTLALRLDVSANPTFRTLVDRVRREVVEAQGHQEVPFEKLVEELKPPRDLSRTPLFQVAFVVQNAPSSKLSAQGLTLERWPLPTETSKFDLTLTLTEEEGRWQGELEASRDLFEATTMERFARNWVRLLESGLAGPGEAVHDLALLLDGERQALLREWNDRTEEPLSGRTLTGIFGEQARARPDAVAVTCDDVHLSYCELQRRARGLARDLRGSGVGRGDKVAVRMERGVELVTALLGVLEAGAAYVPLDPAYPQDRSRLILEDSGASAVVDLARVAGAEPWSEGLEDDAWEPSRAGSEDLAYVIYTSGSTGRPKGVLVPHGRVERLFTVCREDFGFGPDDVWSLFHSYAFDFSVWELWGPLLHGGRLVIVPYWVSRSPADFRKLLASERVTVLNQTPSAFRQLVGVDAQRGGVGLEALRGVVFGGEALEMESLRPWWQLHGEDSPRLVNMYGITETTVHVTHRPLSRKDLERPSRIGRALGDLETQVLDRDLAPVPLAVTGEICVGGAGLAWGYLGRPAQTAERFVPHPLSEAPGERLYRSGDLARWRPQGDLEYQGRLDHQVKVRGFRIELGEIETALANHESVAEAVALARTDVSPGGEAELVGYVVAREGVPEPTPAELREHLKAQLPEQMVPGLYVVLDELPLTEHGKVDRRALPVPERGTGKPDAERIAPRTATERRLAEIWCEVLGLDEVGVQEDFFDLGGHSLLATRLLGRVTESLGVELPLKALFQAPTISELSSRIEREREREDGQALPPLVRVDRDAPLPASFAQERMWLYERLHPGEPTYNTYRAGHTWGLLNPRAAEATYRGLLGRHEVLRTRLEEDDGRVVQVIETATREPLGLVDLRGLPEEARRREARRLAFEDAERPLSLARAPVSRTRLLRLGEQEHVFLLSIHHAAYDLWSGGVVLEEFEELYRSAVEGRPAELPELPVQYADVAAWQRRWMTGEYLEGELQWWRERLAGIVDSPMELPTDRPRPARGTTRGRSLYPGLSVTQREGLWALARSRGVSPYMLLLAVFEAVLARWTGNRDVVVGSFVAHRNRPEMERVVGYLDNTVVLRTDATGDPSFEGFLGRVKETCLEAFAHPYLPYETLVAALAPRRDGNFLGLFGVAFILELDYPAMEREIAGLQVQPYNTHSGTAKFDLGLGFREAPEGLAGELEYNVDLFDETTMWRLAEHLRQMVDGVLEDPSRPLSEMPYLTPGERHQVLYGANDAEASPPEAGVSVPRRILEQSRIRPDAVAVVCEGRHLTYGELARRAWGLAATLQGRGAGPETPVGVYLERSVEAVWAIVGVMAAGACYVPLDPDYPEERLRYMLDEPGSVGLVTDPAGRERFRETSMWTLPLEEVQTAEPPEDLRVPPDSRVYVIYTSGSTGRPKGVVNRHGSLSSFVAGYASQMGHAPGERLLTLLSLAFDASVGGVFPTLCQGATLVLARETSGLSAQALTDLVEAEQVTMLDVPVNFWNHWVEELEALGRTAVAPALARVVSGGEPVYRERLEAWRDLWAGDGIFVGAYGPTETTVAATLEATVGAEAVPAGRSRLPIGRVIPGVRAYALDLQGRAVGLGSVGEIYLGGGHVTRGYLNEPRSTAQRFVPDPWASGDGKPGARLYRTGDWGRRLGDGRLVFVERRDQQVKIRGYRIEPAEVEATLGTHPAVAVCAVRPWSRQGSAYLAAYVVPAPEWELDIDDLRQHLEERLPDYMVPAVFQELEALPFNPASGKVDYRALPEPDAATESSSYVAPRTATEETVAEIFAQVLERPRVGVRDDFFRLGGHSLLATRLLSRLRRRFGVELPLSRFFHEPTVVGVAVALDELEAAAGTPRLPPLEPISRDRTLPLSSAQQRLWFLEQLAPGDAGYNMAATFELSGRLHSEALIRTLGEIVRRHEILRTVFPSEGGRPYQQVLSPRTPAIPRIDLRRLGDDARAEASRRAYEVVERPLPLDRGPLLRPTRMIVAPNRSVMVLAMHHVISDAWSMDVLFDEMATLYEAFRDGRPSPLAELSIQYADYAAWQQECLNAPVSQAHLDYWRERLEDLEPLELPTDRPRGAEGRGRARDLPFVFPPSLAQKASALARERGVTRFILFLSVFQVLLSYYSGRRDVVVGTPVAGREHPKVEPLIGMFVNTLVLRTDLTEHPTFEDVLDGVNRVVTEARDHQAVPLEQIVEELAPQRGPTAQPFFQVMLALQEAASRTLELAELRLEAFPPPTGDLDDGRAKLDLALGLEVSEDTLEGTLAYDMDLYDATTAARFLVHLRVLLEQVVRWPARPLEELCPLTAAERHQLVGEWPREDVTDEPIRDEAGRLVPIGVWGTLAEGDEARWRPRGNVQTKREAQRQARREAVRRRRAELERRKQRSRSRNESSP